MTRRGDKISAFDPVVPSGDARDSNSLILRRFSDGHVGFRSHTQGHSKNGY